MKIEEGRTELTVNHQGRDLKFVYLTYFPGNYANVSDKIESAGLVTPTMAETASLVYGAFNSDDKSSWDVRREIKNAMRYASLWAFTGSLYVPGKGAYIQDNPRVRGGMPFMDESDLVRRLEANDPGVRFVPFGFKIGDMAASELAENQYIIGLAGEEGAVKLAEVAGKHRYNPCLGSFESVDTPQTRVSDLNTYEHLGDGLNVCGRNRGNGLGYALGICKST